MEEADRFWFKVRKSGRCWTWTRCRDKDGYGFLMFRGIRGVKAHRAAYILERGPIPDGKMVCHSCDNPPCVRPSHLFIGTALDNARDAAAKGRTALGKRNGAHTHPEARRKGESHGRSKLTDKKVRKIRALYAQGVNQPSLSRKFGVNQTCIAKVVRRIAWRHVS